MLAHEDSPGRVTVECGGCGRGIVTKTSGDKTRCRECGHRTYVPAGATRSPVWLDCRACGHAWSTRMAAGAPTKCPKCRKARKIPVDARRPPQAPPTSIERQEDRRERPGRVPVYDDPSPDWRDAFIPRPVALRPASASPRPQATATPAPQSPAPLRPIAPVSVPGRRRYTPARQAVPQRLCHVCQVDPLQSPEATHHAWGGGLGGSPAVPVPICAMHVRKLSLLWRTNHTFRTRPIA